MTTIKNWTPIIDTIVERYDLMTAAVFGSVWRHSQMKSGKCTASIATIAEKIGVSEKTVQRKLADLIEDKYIEDLTPDVRNKPHEYRPTNKAGIEFVAQAFDNQEDTESDRSDSESYRSDRESHQRSDSESVEETLSTKDTIQETIKKPQSLKIGAVDGRPPSVEIFRRIVHRYPPKKVWPRIDRVVGQEFTDVLNWARVVKIWLMRGYNPTNYFDMLKVFRHGWRSPNGRGGRQSALDVMQSYLEKAENLPDD